MAGAQDYRPGPADLAHFFLTTPKELITSIMQSRPRMEETMSVQKHMLTLFNFPFRRHLWIQPHLNMITIFGCEPYEDAPAAWQGIVNLTSTFASRFR